MKGIPVAVKGILTDPDRFFDSLRSDGHLHALPAAISSLFSLNVGFVLAEVLFPFVKSAALLIAIGVVLAIAVFIVNASLWWAACRIVGGKARWTHFVNSWGYSLLPLAMVVVPVYVVLLVAGNGLLTPPMMVLGAVILLLTVLASLITLSLKYAVLERVMGLSGWPMAAAVIVFALIMAFPWSLYAGYATITYSTTDLDFFETMKPTLFSAYPSPGAQHIFAIRDTDILFLRTPYIRGNPQRGDVVLYVSDSDLAAEYGVARFPGLTRLAIRAIMSAIGPGRRFAARMGRVVALPGEAVALKDGVVYVDGEREAFPVLVSTGGASLEATVLGDDEFFVIGDNRRADAGMAVRKEQILGRYPRLRIALRRLSIPVVFKVDRDEN